MKDKIYLSLYYSLKCLVSILPKFALELLARFVAKIVFTLNKKHRKIIDINLQICFPNYSADQRKQIAQKIYANFAKFGIDCIKNQNTTPAKILAKTHFDNPHIITAALKSKRPLILTTAHYGNWELAPLAFSAQFAPISIVGRKLDSEAMDKILSQNRTQFNIELIDKKGGLKKMLKSLKDGRVLGILTDQDCADSEALRLEFFGKEVNFLCGASVLAKKTNALLIPCFVYQGEKGFHIKCFEAMDATLHSTLELTQYQAKNCEEMIKFKPDEYFFFHKRFRSFDSKIYEEKL